MNIHSGFFILLHSELLYLGGVPMTLISIHYGVVVACEGFTCVVLLFNKKKSFTF